MSIPFGSIHDNFYKREQFGVLIKHKKYWLFGEVIYIDTWHTLDGLYFDPLRFDLVRSSYEIKSNIFGTKLTCRFIPKRW